MSRLLKSCRITKYWIDAILSSKNCNSMLYMHAYCFLVDRSQKPDDIMRRKIRENKSNLIDELEPSQLISFLIRKKHFSEKDQIDIEQERGRKRRGEKLLDKIRNFPDGRILKSFLEYLKSAGQKDLIDMVQATERDQDIHKQAGISIF